MSRPERPTGHVMDAALELLDRQVLDSAGRAAGKVDDLELTATEEGALIVTAILSGPGALAPRLQGRLGAAWAGVFRRLHPDAEPTAARVAMTEVRRMDDVIELSVDADGLESHRLERWMCDHVIAEESREPAMTPADDASPTRLSDLLGCSVVDRNGDPVGAVRDVRLVQDGPMQANFVAALRVDGLIVGGHATASRLGYDRGDVRGPWLVAMLARRSSRGTRYVRWTDVASFEPGCVSLAVLADSLLPPGPLRSGGPEEGS